MDHPTSLQTYSGTKKTAGHEQKMPVGHPHESIEFAMEHHMRSESNGMPHHKASGSMFTPGKGIMPHKVEANDPERFFAKENDDPLGKAFEGKIAVHPGMGGIPIMPNEKEVQLEKLAETACNGRKLAYIHVPFCETHCLYCSFYQNAYRNEAGTAYTDILIKELALWKDKAAQNGDPIHAVYLGGGTPSALTPKDLGRLLQAVRTYLPLANDCEITLEGRTANLTPERIEVVLENGVNRFSLGVQSFDTSIRRTMGRTLDSEGLFEKIKLLQSYKQASVVIDLIYGLPDQSMDVWQEDLRAARTLGLDGLDCYQLGVHKGSPLDKAIAKGKISPAADAPQMGRMFASSVQTLESAFYRRLSINHWGRTPRERNIYNHYTRGNSSCLGFGPGAGGNLNGYMTYNFRDYQRWSEVVGSGAKPVGMLLAPPPRAALRNALTESLEQGYLDIPSLEAVCKRQEYDGLEEKGKLQTLVSPLLGQWWKCGLLEPSDESFVLTVAGQYWYVNLTQLLIEYIDERLA